MLTSAHGDDLFGMTMDMFRTRIVQAFRAYGQSPDMRLVEELARLMDLSASERVIDEAELNTLPDPEHPTVRDLRDRLRHAQAVIETLSVAPAALFAHTSHMMTPETRASTAQFVLELRREATTPSMSACSAAMSIASVDALDEAVAFVNERAYVAAHDGTPGCQDAARELRAVADELHTLRGAMFRDTASMDMIEMPEQAVIEDGWSRWTDQALAWSWTSTRESSIDSPSLQ